MLCSDSQLLPQRCQALERASFQFVPLTVPRFCREDTEPISQMRTVRFRESKEGAHDYPADSGELGSDTAV